MKYFEFNSDLSSLEERSLFANRICKLIYQKNKGNLENSIKEGEPFFDDLEKFVRNIYELVTNEIPLYAYYELIFYGAESWGYTEDQYKENIEKTILACKKYYEDV